MSLKASLPSVRQAVVDQGGTLSRPYYVHLQALATSVDALASKVGDVTVTPPAPISPNANVTGAFSIYTQGTLKSGIVRVLLQGDTQTPGNTQYYGSDGTGTRGWFNVADTLDSTSNITLTVGTDGVTTFDLANLADSGTGAALVKITRDAKGRVAGTHSATTSDLAEGTNLYFTSDRVYTAAKALLKAGTNVTITPDDTLNTLTIAASGSGGGGIADAPSDGLTYARKNAAWVAISTGVAAVVCITASPTVFSTGTSQSQAIPAGAAVGDLLLASIMHRDTLTPPTGWTLVARAGPVSAFAQYTSVYKRIAVSGDAGATTTWTQATSQRMAVHIQVFRKTGGCDVLNSATQSINGTGTDNFAFTTPLVGSAGQMLMATGSIALAATTGTNTFAASTGWWMTTPTSSTDTTNQIRLGAAFMQATAPGTVTGTFTVNAGGSANSWVVVTVLIG